MKADAPSRLREGKTVPKRLENLEKRESPIRNDSFCKVRPTDWKNVGILHEWETACRKCNASPFARVAHGETDPAMML